MFGTNKNLNPHTRVAHQGRENDEFVGEQIKYANKRLIITLHFFFFFGMSMSIGNDVQLFRLLLDSVRNFFKRVFQFKNLKHLNDWLTCFEHQNAPRAIQMGHLTSAIYLIYPEPYSFCSVNFQMGHTISSHELARIDAFQS